MSDRVRGWRIPAGSGDAWVDDYERGRPGWPRRAVEVAGVPASAGVLDLGAGTGKLTRLLVRTFERVAAVEPADAMRRVLLATCVEADVRDGSAEQIPLTDEAVDAVFAAEAFHRFDRDKAVAEIARVLRPRGALVLMWNLPAGAADPAIADAERFLKRHVPVGESLAYDPLDLNPITYASGEWRRAFAASPFDELRETRMTHEQVVDRDGLVAFFASMGWFGDLPDEERLPLIAELRARLPDAEFRRPWEARVHWTRLRARRMSD